MTMTKKTAPKLTKDQQTMINQLTGYGSTSARIRYLDSVGYSRGDIGRILQIRYQHVKNVLDFPLKG